MLKIFLIITIITISCFGNTEYINSFTNVSGKVTTNIPIISKIEIIPNLIKKASNKNLIKK